MTSLDTEVAGDPAAVTKAASWLRDTLAKNLEAAGNDQQDARNSSRGMWEGETASSYRNFAGDLLRANDKHEARVKRAATALDQYSARLQRCINDMTDIRDRARSGGLTVSGTVISQPPDAPSDTFEPGSTQERAHLKAVDKIELWNDLVEDSAFARQYFTDWADTEMPEAVADAREKDASDTLLDGLKSSIPTIAAAAASFASVAMLGKAEAYKAAATEFQRRSRVSGDPRIRGSAGSPVGRAQLDELLGTAKWLKKGGRFLGGPGGLILDVGFGIQEGRETGDWTRPVLTTGASIATGVAVVAGAGALAAAGIVTAPVWVVGGAVILASGAVAYGVGEVYDNWDDITDWTDDRADDVKSFASDTWDNTTDVVSNTWDSVTPW